MKYVTKSLFEMDGYKKQTTKQNINILNQFVVKSYFKIFNMFEEVCRLYKYECFDYTSKS